MRIGFDFDNTIVCYDQAIKILTDKLNLPEELTRNKLSIREYLRNQNRENDWTKFQGTLYGPGMAYAMPHAFFIEVANYLKLHHHELFIISHRTKYAYAGEKHDLHHFAREWLELKINSNQLINTKNILFLETLENKIMKIKENKIDLFIDDLPEVINHKNFPTKTKSILFDPDNNKLKIVNRITNWKQLINHVPA
jgi:hypothetical protein